MKTYGLLHSKAWYEHRAEKVIKNYDVKILWNLNIYVDKFIEARQPDIVLIRKRLKECILIDIAIHIDARTMAKENEKIDKYRDLVREVSRLWDMKTSAVPIVIGALATIIERLVPYLAMLGVNLSFEAIQKAALLGSAHSLRKVLEKDE